MSWEVPDKKRDEDEPYEESPDREPRKPKSPNKSGGAEAPLVWKYEPEEGEEITITYV